MNTLSLLQNSIMMEMGLIHFSGLVLPTVQDLKALLCQMNMAGKGMKNFKSSKKKKDEKI